MYLLKPFLGSLAVLAFLVGSLASVSLAFAQPRVVDLYQRLDEMHHTVWSEKDGLVGRPSSLAQTSDGYLWIGTSGGLYRFDGVSFEHFEPREGALPGAAIRSLLATRDGGLWVGYVDAGATFIRKDGRIDNYSTREGLPIGAIRSFAEDHDGVIWLAATGGLARLENGRWLSVRTEWRYPCRSAWKLLVQRDGTLWVVAASPNKLLYLPKGTRAFVDVGLSIEAGGLMQTDDHTILVANNPTEEVFEVRREGSGRATWRKLNVHLASRALALDRDGGAWSVANGVTRMRLDRLAAPEPNHAESKHAQPKRAQPDHAQPAGAEQLTLENGLSGRNGHAVLVDREHNVWVATDTGLDRFRRRNLSWKADPSMRDDVGLVTGGNGEVWQLSRAAPLIKRAIDAMPVRNGPSGFWMGFPDPDGSVWLSKGNEFLHWRDDRFTSVRARAVTVASCATATA